MNLLKDFKAKEAKALLGFEVGHLTFQRLPELKGLQQMANGYLLYSAARALQRSTRPNAGLAGAPGWIREMLGVRTFQRPYSYSGTTGELAALGTLLRRLLPGVLQPPFFELLQAENFVFFFLVKNGKKAKRQGEELKKLQESTDVKGF